MKCFVEYIQVIMLQHNVYVVSLVEVVIFPVE